jgi:putative MATE family efflux protein
MKDFTTGNVPKLMIGFLFPLLLSNMLQALYMLIDAVWAGRLLGPTGVAIVTTGMPVVFFMASFIAGITIGASILAGHAYGSKNKALLSDIVSTSVISLFVTALVISIAGVIWCGPLLKLINTPPQLFGGAKIFLSLVIGAMAISSLNQWFGAMMNAAGDSRTPFKVLLVSLAINAVLAPILITGAGIFRPLGVAGSALSTIIANIAGVIICFFVWRSHTLSKIAPFKFQLHLNTLKKITVVGFPMALQMLIVSSSFLFILSLANRFGADVTAAFGIGSRVDQFAFFALFSVTMAISAMTAQNIGAGKLERIPEITRWGVTISLVFAFLFCGVVVLFPNLVTSMFTKDPKIMLLTKHYFYIVGFSYIALAVLFSFQGVLRGAGDTLTSFWIVSSTMVILRVPIAYFLSHTYLQESGLWAGITTSSCIGAVAFYFYYKGGKWKTKGTRLSRPDDIEPTVLQTEAIQAE